jgi:alpha-tubulin suppressor-like RCC1 family protein
MPLLTIIALVHAGCDDARTGPDARADDRTTVEEARPQASSDTARPPAKNLEVEAHGPFPPVRQGAAADDVVQLASGSEYTCARSRRGAVVCWGNDEAGLSGLDDPQYLGGPRLIEGLGPFTDLSPGDTSLCAIGLNGKASCWGNHLPVKELEVEGVVEVAVTSPERACGRLRSGDLTCWGAGAPSTTGVPPDIVELESSRGSICARTKVGSVTCSRGDEPFEVVPGIAAAKSLSVGIGGVCVVHGDGGVTCWRSDERESVLPTRPTRIAKLSDVAEVAVGGAHACALHADETVSCWGRGSEGQLGVDTNEDHEEPVTLGLKGVVEIDAGNQHSCARLRSGEVLCWGNINTDVHPFNAINLINIAGLPQHPASFFRYRHLRAGLPVEVSGIRGAKSVALGENHSCALLSSGEVWCWGGNAFGQLGDGGTGLRATPSKVAGLTDVEELTAGLHHTCARRRDGEVLCWGHGEYGELGDGNATNSTTPIVVEAVRGAEHLFSWGFINCARQAGGETLCWGTGGPGFLKAPTHVPLYDGATSAGRGQWRDCSLYENGEAKCWSGISGPNVTTHRRYIEARTDATFQGVEALAVGVNHACMVSERGELSCWGNNDSGVLGDEIDGTSAVPVEIQGLSEVTDVVAGDGFSCAVHGGGKVACWGQNDDGVLGNDGTDPRARPVTIWPAGRVIDLAAGVDHLCAVRTDGAVLCWGTAIHGQVGDGRASYRTLPTLVDLAPAFSHAEIERPPSPGEAGVVPMKAP